METALTGMVQRVGHCPADKRVQQFNSRSGHMQVPSWGKLISVLLAHHYFFPFLSPSLLSL